MAFYFSPLVFAVLRALLVVGAILGMIGAVTGPRWFHRAIAVVTALACFVWVTQLP
jgi:hypothetical protein